MKFRIKVRKFARSFKEGSRQQPNTQGEPLATRPSLNKSDGDVYFTNNNFFEATKRSAAILYKYTPVASELASSVT